MEDITGVNFAIIIEEMYLGVVIMKYFFTAIWAIVCMMVLFFGHSYWNERTAVQADQPPAIVVPQADEVKLDEYLELAKNWPQAARQQFKQALQDKQPYKILFVGSTALQWEKDVSRSLTESYGSERIITAQHTYDLTSNDMVAENKQLEIAAEKAQLIVIEPFLLNDNSIVSIDVTLANLTKMIDDVKLTTPDTTFILQPSYPIYLPKYYSVQVEALKEYAIENNLTYLDHWSAWPATDNPEINDYLTDDQSGPNQKGYQVWSQFISDYLISKAN